MTLDSCTFEEFISIFLKRDYEAIKNLLSSRTFDINSEDFRGVTALHYAAELNDVELIKLILEQPKARINVKTLNMGSTPLMIAAGHDTIEALKYLLERGADVSQINNNGFTALMIAAETGSAECVKALLDGVRNSDVNAQNHSGANALMLGIEYPEVVGLLINLTDLSQEDLYQANALHYACASGSFEVVRELLNKNVFDVNKPANDGKRAVHIAIERQDFQLVQYLIENGAHLLLNDANNHCGYRYIINYDDSETFIDNIDCPDEILEDIILFAIMYNRVKTLRNYLDRFLKISDHHSESFKKFIGLLLNTASMFGSFECLKQLFSVKIDESFLETSLMYALQHKNYDCFKYIYEHLPENYKLDMISFLPTAIETGCYEACKMIFDKQEIDPNGPDPETYLMVASGNGHLEIVKLLVEHGADINRIHERLGSALILSVVNNYLGIIKYLLENGADFTVADQNGYTPLICSAFYGNYESFNELYAKDKNIHQQAKDGITAFLAACTSTNVDLVHEIVKIGANIKDVDLNNFNCLHIAAEDPENLPVLLYLLEKIDNDNLDEMLNSKNAQGKTPLDLIIGHADQKYLFSILAAKVDFDKYFSCPKIFEIETNDNEDMCLICRDEFVCGVHVTQLPCKHLFHENCFNEWSITKANCPYCQRFPFKLKN